MKLRLVCVGKLSTPFIKAGVDDYLTRVRRYTSIEIIETKEGRGSTGKKIFAQNVAREGENILRKISSEAVVIALDERGREMSSRQLAIFLEKHMVEGTGELVFVIGGAYGLSEAVKGRCDTILSLSRLTLPHQLARLLLLEQIYRGFTILRNEPYHNA